MQKEILVGASATVQENILYVFSLKNKFILFILLIFDMDLMNSYSKLNQKL